MANNSGEGDRGDQAQTTPATVADIQITPDADQVVDQAVAALTNDECLYQRGGSLVRVLRDTSPAGGEGGIRRAFSPRIDLLPRATLFERLAAAANWWKKDKEGNLKRALPPDWAVKAVDARGEWPDVRHLEGITEYPVLRADGTLLVTPGYDPDTGLLFEPNGVHGTLKKTPGLAEAQNAVAELLEVVEDFPFLNDVHKAGWLAALLTPLARYAFAGPAPLFLSDANAPGTGKGLLLDCVSRIVTGERFTVTTYSDDRNEMRKRITSLALGGERLVLLDNVAGGFGCPELDAVLTATSWSDRILGGNRMASLPLYATWYATGNNVRVLGDTPRRVCYIRLDSPEERPERRQDFKHPQLLAWVGENRGRLLVAALTVLRAYCVAGRPQQNLTAWGSFEGWSSLVRQAIVWAGQKDPGQSRLQLEEDADTTAQAMAVMLEGWELMDTKGEGLLAADVLDRLYKNPPAPVPDWHRLMRDALESLLGRPDAHRLGYKLRAYRRRVFGGRFLDHAGTDHKTIKWAVYPASDFKRLVLGQHTSQPSEDVPQSREPGEEG
jgi:hypothetical protein